MVAATFNLDAEFLVAAFNVARIGICVVDEEGRFIEANPSFCELYITKPFKLEQLREAIQKRLSG